MYKSHIAKWGLDKKNKEPEMRAIIRKNQQRAEQGKRSRFRVRKRDLDFAEVIRYWKRKGVAVDEVIARSMASPTPETVECFTVVSSPITPPEDLATPEYILRIIRGYTAASFESGTWVKTDPRNLCYSTKAPKDVNSIADFSNMCQLAIELFSIQNLDQAHNTLSTTSVKIRKMLIAEQPETLTIILERVVMMQFYHCHDMALRLLHQLSASSKQLLGENHPICLFTAWLAAMPRSQIKDVVSRCFDVVTADFESLVGPTHLSTLSCRLATIDLSHNLATLRRFLNRCESVLGSLDKRALDVRVHLMYCAWSEGHDADTMSMSEDLLAFLQSTNAILNSNWFKIQCYTLIANFYHALDELDQAIANIQAAIDLRITHCGSQNAGLSRSLFTLERWYIEQGNLDAAMIVRDQRIRLLRSTIMISLGRHS